MNRDRVDDAALRDRDPWREPLRRLLPVAIAAAALSGCEPSVPKGSSSASLQYVVFDPSTSQLPLPNDLAWLQAPTGAPRDAREELLQLVAARRGFPGDEEVAIAIDVQRAVVDARGTQRSAPPPVDASTLAPTTLLVLDTDLATGATLPVPALDPEYVAGLDRGTLILRNPPWSYDPADPARKSRRWKASHRYAVILRGGPSGAKLVRGDQLSAMPAL